MPFCLPSTCLPYTCHIAYFLHAAFTLSHHTFTLRFCHTSSFSAALPSCSSRLIPLLILYTSCRLRSATPWLCLVLFLHLHCYVLRTLHTAGTAPLSTTYYQNVIWFRSRRCRDLRSQRADACRLPNAIPTPPKRASRRTAGYHRRVAAFVACCLPRLRYACSRHLPLAPPLFLPAAKLPLTRRCLPCLPHVV